MFLVLIPSCLRINMYFFNSKDSYQVPWNHAESIMYLHLHSHRERSILIWLIFNAGTWGLSLICHFHSPTLHQAPSVIKSPQDALYLRSASTRLTRPTLCGRCAGSGPHPAAWAAARTPSGGLAPWAFPVGAHAARGGVQLSVKVCGVQVAMQVFCKCDWCLQTSLFGTPAIILSVGWPRIISWSLNAKNRFFWEAILPQDCNLESLPEFPDGLTDSRLASHHNHRSQCSSFKSISTIYQLWKSNQSAGSVSPRTLADRRVICISDRQWADTREHYLHGLCCLSWGTLTALRINPKTPALRRESHVVLRGSLCPWPTGWRARTALLRRDLAMGWGQNGELVPSFIRFPNAEGKRINSIYEA